MAEITPHMGDYKPGRIQITNDVWIDPPELIQTSFVGLEEDCEHEFVAPIITGTLNFYGDGWHLAILTEACIHCGGDRIQSWKTAAWYEGMDESQS